MVFLQPLFKTNCAYPRFMEQDNTGIRCQGPRYRVPYAAARNGRALTFWYPTLPVSLLIFFYFFPMRIGSFAVLLFGLLILTGYGQASIDKPLTLTLTLADNNYQNKARSRSALRLTNTGDKPLPATGWQLYFNDGDPATFDASVAQVMPVNGDLFYLRPGPAFRALAPGSSTTVEFLSGKIRSATDYAAGFYLVFTDKPAQAFPLPLTIDAAGQFDQSDRLVTERIFDQNALIQPVADDKLLQVFPTPVSYQEKGQPFRLDNQVVIVAQKEFGPEAEFLASALATLFDMKPLIQPQATGRTIALRKDPAIAPEGYALQIDANGVRLSASSGAGLFYGIQSLQTLLPTGALANKSGSVSLPGLVVNDAPRFGYRALMLDVARNFQPKSQVLKVLDLMALYKLNTLHFHFSEDEGWRVEMPSLPELTAVGAKRAHAPDESANLIPAYGSGPSTDNPAGTGFYSKADFVEILRYARDRHIAVIPEIESPGHGRAALRAMDARYNRLMKAGNKVEAERYLLRDLGDKSVYQSVQGFTDNVMNVALPSTYAFMERVVDDLRSMYQEAGAPLKTIHVGGDEVPTGVWTKSPAVQRLAAKDPSAASPTGLWVYYFGKMNQLLKSRGLFLSGWEEAGLTKVTRNGQSAWVPNPAYAAQQFRVNVWLNSPGSGSEDLAYRMANAGYQVILTAVTHLYLDMAYNPSSGEPGQYWGGYVDIDKPFYFIPYNYLRIIKDDRTGRQLDPSVIKGRVPLTARGQANIIGIEAPLWAETHKSPADLEYKLLPKLLSVAERAWAKDPAWATETDPAKSDALYGRAWSEFINRVGKRELPRLDTYGGGFQYRIPTAGAKRIGGKLAANVQFPGMFIRYTTDGTEPTATSPLYTEPIAAPGPVKLTVFTAAGRAGRTVTINE